MHDTNLKCLLCGNPFLVHYIEEVQEVNENANQSVSNLQSFVGQIVTTEDPKNGITIFADNGNYGSTILDCDATWAILFHDSCLMQAKSEGKVLVMLEP